MFQNFRQQHDIKTLVFCRDTGNIAVVVVFRIVKIACAIVLRLVMGMREKKFPSPFSRTGIQDEKPFFRILGCISDKLSYGAPVHVYDIEE